MNNQITYDELKIHISNVLHLNYDPSKDAIQFFKPTEQKEPSKSPISTKFAPKMTSFFYVKPDTYGLDTFRIYFQFNKGISEKELQDKVRIDFSFSSDSIHIDKSEIFSLIKEEQENKYNDKDSL